MKNTKNHYRELVSKSDIKRMLGVGDGYLKQLMQKPLFPEPLMTGPKKHFYSKQAVLDFINNQDGKKSTKSYEEFVVFPKRYEKA